MAKTTQLELIRDLARSREHDLAAEVGELRRLQVNAQVALNRLDTYLAEYTAGTSTGNGRAVTQVENERRFVKRLNRAVEQQRLRTLQFSEKVTQKLQSWQRERAQLKALDRAVNQRHKLSVRRQERREQTEAEAISGRQLSLKRRPDYL